MKRLEFTCDGCDLVEHMELPLDGNANFLAEGWIAHRVASEENGAIVSQIADRPRESPCICPSCICPFRALPSSSWRASSLD
jgi:hypothetical protein